MQFTKLRLVGFKSFVEPMEFIIERGLTGVVGPNGCGKSNLVEALRWVMGENSYKNMRASGMDDVIFSGNNTRPPRNSAEVILFLDNLDGSAPSAFNDADELQVSRRIERSAGSTYRINGKEVRAKDVQLLFADQSTGARSPSMVGQGRIGELIQAKPQARRALLEEAAGISGLHSRRHEAELRLRAAEGNLDRLEDVVGDLSTRIESLKRQARQANRFKNLSADIRKIEAGLFYLRWSQAKSVEAEEESALSSATLLVGEKAEAQMRAAREQALGKQGLPPLRDEVAKAGAALQRMTLMAKALEDERARATARQSELMRRLEQLQRDLEREEGLAKENNEFLARLAEEEETLKIMGEDSAAHEEEMRERYETLHIQAEQSEAELSALTAKRAELNAEYQQTRRLVDDMARRGEKLEADLTAIVEAIKNIDQQIEAAGDADAAREEVEALEEALAVLEEDTQRFEQAVIEARSAEEQARRQSDAARNNLNVFEAESTTLEKMLAAFSSGDFGAVVDEIIVEKGYEIALGAALGDDLEAALDENAPLYWADIPLLADDPELPQNVPALADFVKAPDALQRRLRQIGIVAGDKAFLLQKELSSGQVLVSLDGALWRWDGITARADAPTAAAQRLAQKNRLVELGELISEATTAFEAAEAAREQAVHEVQQSVEAERNARSATRTTRETLDKARVRLGDIERMVNERISRRTALHENEMRLKEELDEYAILREEMAIKLEELPPLEGLDAQISQLNLRLGEERGAVAKARAAQETWRNEVAQRQRRLEAIAGERQSWKARIKNAEQQIADLKDRMGETREEAEALAEAPDDMEERKKALFDEIVKAEAIVRERNDQLSVAENAQSTLDQVATDAIQALSSSREARGRAEERLHAAIDRRKDIEARIAEALNIPPHETIQLAGLSAGQKMPEIDVLERELERARIERERLGAVNLRAEEEQQELLDRYQTMTVERDDVIEAIKKLRQAIHGLNREGRERLLAAFEKVDTEFRRLFTHLFGGGTAELQLIESDDPLNAGLEILARPPGKKPQTMTLLSGGEQALTAMALIFAVFLTNPAPICVLDEVDAPLDDHNVERYCNLMDEMAASTQTRFVVITHNPITMARMNRLFGVTMGEQGVSQLVSVDLKAAEKLLDTVA